MISTKFLVGSLEDVPQTWIFEYYAKLNVQLSGQDVNIKSLFNPVDKNPSFFVYVKKGTGEYLFKDYSVGKGGDGVDRKSVV